MKKSLVSDFSYKIALLILVNLAIFLIVLNYFYIDKRDKELMNEFISTTAFTSKAISNSIWDFNEPAIKDLLTAVFLSDNVIYIEVFSGKDSLEKLYKKKFKNYSFDELRVMSDLVAKESKIFYEGEEIGILKIIFSKEVLLDEVLSNTIAILIFTLFLALSIFVATIYIFKKHVIYPINRLNLYAKKIANGKLNIKINLTTENELSLLAYNLDNMRQSIKSLVLDLETHNKKLGKIVDKRTARLRLTIEELNEYKENLEKKVAKAIDEKREKDKILIQQSKMAAMGEMIGAIAHQWRQPLNALGLVIQDLHDAYEYGEVDEKYIDELIESSMIQINYMSKTIDDFRSFFKTSKVKSKFSIKEAVLESKNLIDAQFKNLSISIKVSIKDDITINSYKNEFKQVLLNIFNNAKDAILDMRKKKSSKVEGLISIIVAKKDNFIYIRVLDNGLGIDEKIKNKIFNPYFSTKFASQGTGIGLYMSKVIITDNMRGSISAKNHGNGAEFIIKLPINLN